MGCKNIFIDDLPMELGAVNWEKSVGYKIKFIYNDIKSEVEVTSYSEVNHRLIIKYGTKEIDISTYHFMNCKIGKLLKRNEVEIGMVFTDGEKGRNLEITDMEYRYDKKEGHRQTWWKYTCNNCGWKEGWIKESNLTYSKNGCSCCWGRVVVEGINDIPTTTPWMTPFFQGGYAEAKLYTNSSSKKIFPFCPDCGKMKQKQKTISKIYIEKSICCPCGDGMSYPEKFMFALLEKVGVQFETQFSPDWVKPMRYDFYFEHNHKKYIVETDGAFHNSDNHMTGQTHNQSKDIDDYKERLAEENSIKVIHIDCDKSDFDYIKNNIIGSELGTLYDLTGIDWHSIESFALSNLVRVACEHKRLNPSISTLEISSIMKLSNVTIRKYLNKGAKLGWCTYIPKDELRRSVVLNGKKNGKPIEIYKGDILLGNFASVMELERKSTALFGVELESRRVGSACRTGEKYLGYTFKYLV